MSHFSVLVTGEDVAGQLQPYHEFESTGIDDEYVRNVDITKELEKEYLEEAEGLASGRSFAEFAMYWHDLPVLPSGVEPKLNAEHKFGWVQLAEPGYRVRVIKRTNPKAKWDWWEVGGRLSGLLLNKAGEWVEVCTKEDLDYPRMNREAIGVKFAVVSGGQWYERGEGKMGEWHKEYWGLVDSLSDYTLLTVVDCHI